MALNLIDTMIEGVRRSEARNVGLTSIALFFFTLLNSIATVSVVTSRFMQSSQVSQYVAGPVNTTVTFPLALTDSMTVAAALFLIGTVGYILSFVVLIRLYLDDGSKQFPQEHLTELLRPAANILGGSITVLLVLGMGLVLALYPTTLLMRNMIAGPLSFIVFIGGLVVYGVLALYFISSVIFFIPFVVDKRQNFIEAFKSSFRLTGEDKFKFLLLILGTALLALAVSIIGKLFAMPIDHLSQYIQPALTTLASVVAVLFQWGIIVEAYERVQ